MTISAFDLAAALGLDRPIEPAKMVAMVAEQREQRDDARRGWLEHIFDRKPGEPVSSALRAAANRKGWGYLYPEAPEPGPPGAGCDECTDVGTWACSKHAVDVQGADAGDCDACGEPVSSDDVVERDIEPEVQRGHSACLLALERSPDRLIATYANVESLPHRLPDGHRLVMLVGGELEEYGQP